MWYRHHMRPLPWRENPTPYRVWISEIMLQQTRIEAVLPYFDRFIAAFPTIRDLAEASEDTVLKLWEGLGYYSRARNLQKTARELMKREGALPASYEELLKLPGIGGVYRRGGGFHCFWNSCAGGGWQRHAGTGPGC